MENYQEIALILENDSGLDQSIKDFTEEIEHRYDFDIITNLSRHDPKDIAERFHKADAIVLSTTFSNKEQNKFFLNLLDNSTGEKEIFIHYLRDRLHIGLSDLFEEEPKWSHKIYEIQYDGKRTDDGTGYFKSFKYYYDIIPYYWNSRYGAFFPQRPKCIIDNLKDIYLYEPEWIEK